MITPFQNMDSDWLEILGEEIKKPYFIRLMSILEDEYVKARIFPPQHQIFNAFQKVPFKKVKVVLLGQDPYHGIGQAHGLSFSVPDGTKPPRSLINIFKELHSDLKCTIPTTGNLEPWARQGVLLLNTTLTVKEKTPLSHQYMGWETLTDKVIETLSKNRKGLIFLLWGKNAQAKENLIDTSRHTILKAAHPSPFSAANGFFGSRHFSKVNEILIKQGIETIDWRIEKD